MHAPRSVHVVLTSWLGGCGGPADPATGSSGTTAGETTSTATGEDTSSTTSIASGTSTSTSNAESSSDSSSTHADESGESSSTGAPVDGLVDRGVLVRYFLDEADDGQGPTEALDATDDPVDLQLEYSADPEQPAYVNVATGRGLAWSSMLNAGSARGVVGDALSDALSGSTTATIELVMTIEGVGPVVLGGSRLLSIGDAYYGPLSIGGDSEQGLRLTWDNQPFVRWPADGLFAGERVVVHLVVDTSRANAAERARLYVGGTLRAPDPDFQLSLDMTNAIADDDVLVLGNAVTPHRVDGGPLEGNSPEGTIAYAAIYSVALDELEIADNVAILAVNDDAP